MDYSINDILYGFLYVNSTYNPVTNQLYITGKVKSELIKQFKATASISDRTVNRHFAKYLEPDVNLITLDPKTGNYVFNTNFSVWSLVDADMLSYLVNTRSVNCIKVYVYLLNKHQYFTKKMGQEYIFTAKELLLALGYSEATSSKNQATLAMITDILESLQREGIINYLDTWELNEEGKPMPIKKLINVETKRPE